jgi:hypothetical protein
MEYVEAKDELHYVKQKEQFKGSEKACKDA